MIRTVCALLLTVTCTFALVASSTAASTTLPPAERAKIHAILAPFDYYPATLPSGTIFIKWTDNQLTPMACGTNVAIEFAGNGQIEWSSSRSCGSDGSVRCDPTGYPGYGLDWTLVSRLPKSMVAACTSRQGMTDRTRGRAFRFPAATWRSSAFGRIR